MYKIVVFVSGRGSNLKAILDSNSKNFKIAAIVSDKIDCSAFSIADKYKIPKFSVSSKLQDGYLDYHQLLVHLIDIKTDLIVLAGFLKKVPDIIVDEFQGKIINIHPALLPSFGGKGMYGSHVHKAVFEKSCKVSGATIHFVDKIYDNGKIIEQKSVNIGDVISPKQIADRVLRIEHEILPYVIEKFSQNKIEIQNNRVLIKT